MFKSGQYKVSGYINNCFHYDPCPLCYKCKNFGTWAKCDFLCGNNKKQNACINELHNPTNYNKMISRPKIDLDKIHKEE